MKHKNEAFDFFKKVYMEIKTQHGVRVKRFRSDGGGEFVSNEFSTFLERKGIYRSQTPPHTPHRNGVAERLNRTLLDKARSMLIARNLDKQFWGEAINTANFLKNRSLTKSINMTPEQAYTGDIPRGQYLRIFGQPSEEKVRCSNQIRDLRGVCSKR